MGSAAALLERESGIGNHARVRRRREIEREALRL
jgi:hypothetical protein